MMDRILFQDTTLRDGDQTPGVNFSVSQKEELARLLEDAGVDFIEAGFPAASPGDFKAVQSIAAALKHAGVTALARANEKDIEAARDALCGAAHPRIHVFLALSDLHLKEKLNLSREDALDAIDRSVRLARNYCDDVEFSAEDATRADRAFLAQAFRRAAEAGASVLNVPDTVGVSTPAEFADLITYLKNADGLRGKCFSVHCHNDLGLAVSNTLSGLAAGAQMAECTINGIGERAGNASLEQIAMALKVKRETYRKEFALDTKKLLNLSKTVSALSGVPVSPTAPIVGANAFAQESGIHQHGILKNRKTYQIIDPEDLGLKETSLVLGKLSGRHAFSEKARELGFSLEKEQLEEAFAAFLQLADRKKIVRDDEVEAILEDQRDARILSEGFHLTAFQIQSNSGGMASADITLSKKGKTLRDAATGTGPIEAAFHTVDRIVDRKVVLDAYRIRAVTEGTDALGVVQVKIRYQEQSFTGRGVSLDIIEASIKAYINAINRALFFTEAGK